MIFKASGADIYYEKRGAGKPLILLHGNGEDHTIFDKALPLLEKHFTVYAVDTRGHGASSPADELHYDEMAQDIYEFLCKMSLEGCVLYGFSDGGIIGLILAIKYPGLLSRVIASGPNVTPKGLKLIWRLQFKIIYFLTRSRNYKLMIHEPNITDDELRGISIPVHITGGEKDMISLSHMKHIAECIKCSELTILPGETHDSYVTGSTKIGEIIVKSAL